MTVMAPSTLAVLVEEPSAEVALGHLLPKIVPGVPFEFVVFRSKPDLLRKLPQRLAHYAREMTYRNVRVVVLVDRDGDDCSLLKAKLEAMAAAVNLKTPSTGHGPSAVIFRIVVEELEAWFFGDVTAMRKAYPRLSPHLGKRAEYRDPDNISGKTCHAFEHVLRDHGYHRGGLAKKQAANDISPHMDVDNNRSKSFQIFRDGVRRLVSEGTHAEAH